MGNIRPTYIKRVAIELVKTYNKEFTDDFEYNKKMVGLLTDVQIESLRNKIAGYVTTYRKHYIDWMLFLNEHCIDWMSFFQTIRWFS